MAPGEDEKGEHQFGDVAEAYVQQAADRAAGMLGELLGGAAEPVGEHGNGDRTAYEDPNGRRIDEMAQGKGQRNEQQQGVGHQCEAVAQPASRGKLL